MNKHQRITFRELVLATDLEAAFLWRYQFFQASEYRPFMNHTSRQIDLDQADYYSRHWGAFNDDHQMIGYARIVQMDSNDGIASAMIRIAKKYSLTIMFSSDSHYPILTYQSSTSRKVIKTFLSRQFSSQVIELSRFLIQPNTPFTVARFMVNAGLGIYRQILSDPIVLLSCRDRHQYFWQRYGFCRIPGDEGFWTGKIRSVNLCSGLDVADQRTERLLAKYGAIYQDQQTITSSL